MAAFLLDQGAGDEDGRGLWTACYTGNLEVAKALLSHPKPLYSSTELESGFMVAVFRSAADFLDLFLDFEVDVNAKDSTGRTALIIACESEAPFGAANSVKRLLKRGADIFMTLDSNGSHKHYSICTSLPRALYSSFIVFC
jgi:ankyrin repeat protein